MIAQRSVAPAVPTARAFRSSIDRREGLSKPEGGYRLLTVPQLAMAWSAYKTGAIQFLDLRVYWATHEADSRRCVVKPGQNSPTYELEELRRLTGARHVLAVRHALRRLERTGLLKWGSGGCRFATTLDEFTVSDIAPTQAMLDTIENNRRKVPVPRRTLRLLAGGARRAVAATVLGHLLRCVYFRSGECAMAGACKTSWVAQTFGLDVRKVKEARAHLRDIGWLTLLTVPHWYSNRWGAHVVVNPAWRQESAEFSTTKSAPVAAVPTGESAPPVTNKNPLREEFRNQKPTRAADRGHLVSSERIRKETLGKPTLRDVRIEDLRDTGRLLQLFSEAVKLRLVNAGEAARLSIVAAAEHALAIGSINPPGLFAWLVRSGEWHHITEAADEAARRRLKRHDFGDDRRDGEGLEAVRGEVGDWP